MSDAVQFFLAWVVNPLRIASIIPSSRALAKAMTSEIGHDTAPVIELGPGTGVFTHALLERGIPEGRLILVEYGRKFASLLEARYPDADVVCADAAILRKLQIFDLEQPGAVVSGLPLFSMPMRKVYAILRGAFRHLRDDGAFYQFTYGPRCPISQPVLDRLGLQAESLGWVRENFPPAQIFRIRRRRISFSRPATSRHGAVTKL